MKNLILHLLAAVIFASLGSSAALAEQIAIVDVQKVVNESIIGKAAKSNVEAQIQKAKVRMSNLQAELEKGKAAISVSGKDKLAEVFEALIEAVRKGELDEQIKAVQSAAKASRKAA
jgi:Skp family chaperone for outer membrane proteins